MVDWTRIVFVCAVVLVGCGDADDPMTTMDASSDASPDADAADSSMLIAADHCFIAYGPLPNPALVGSEGGQNILMADYATKETYVMGAQTMFVADVVEALGIDVSKIETQM